MGGRRITRDMSLVWTYERVLANPLVATDASGELQEHENKCKEMAGPFRQAA